LGVPVEIAQPFGLQATGNHAVEQMAREVQADVLARIADHHPEP
jgi:hypothetical protein